MTSPDDAKWLQQMRSFALDAKERRTLNHAGDSEGIVRMAPDDVLRLCELAASFPKLSAETTMITTGVSEEDACEDCGQEIARVHVDHPDPRQVCFPCALAAAWNVDRDEVEKWVIPSAPEAEIRIEPCIDPRSGHEF